jgi:hypothetical protein
MRWLAPSISDVDTFPLYCATSDFDSTVNGTMEHEFAQVVALKVESNYEKANLLDVSANPASCNLTSVSFLLER